MAVFTGSPTSGPVYANQISVNLGRSENVEGAMQFARLGVYTHAAGAGTGEINLVTLPAGRIIILPLECQIITSQFATGAKFDIGTRAFTNEDGTVVAEAPVRYVTDSAAGGGPLNTTFNGAARVEVLDSQEGVTIYMTVDTGNIEDGDTIDGWCRYVRLR